MAKINDWTKLDGLVYSTNPDIMAKKQEELKANTTPNKQDLRVWKEFRNGKPVVVIKEFTGSEDDLDKLGRMLKSKCGVGGTVKEGEIMIQGDIRDKVCQILEKEGYKYKKAGGK